MDSTDRPSRVGDLCRGVTWIDRLPYFDLLENDRADPLIGRRLGLRILAGEPRCLGYSGAVNGVLTRLSCPRDALATSGQQCEECAARDEFRFAHHAHLGGYVPDSLADYLAQPHWVYIATFADATSKVGTASDPRKTSRLDEQGAAAATYLARVPDGRLARIFEDTVTERAGIVQIKRRSAKVAALTRSVPSEVVRDEHRDAVDQAREALESLPRGTGGTLTGQRWERPAAADGFFVDVPIGGWLPYPHDLTAGEHGFHIDAVAGSAALARLRDRRDAVAYVIDLGALAGYRIARGPYSSPNTPEQMSLF